MTVRESVDCFLQDLVEKKGFSNNTISAYRNDLSQFQAFLQHDQQCDSWREATEEDLKAYMLFLRDRSYAASTVARKTAAVRSFCQYLVDEQVVRANLSDGLSAPRVSKSIPKVMTPAEVEQLFDQLLNSESSDLLRDLAMLKLLYGTGMRVSELVNLDIKDLDLAHACLICPGRQGRTRKLPLPPEVSGVIDEYLAQQRRHQDGDLDGDRPLFLNHRGQRLTRQGFWLILKQYAQSAGIDAITPHTLRHSFATHQVMAGRDISEVQQLLGHVSSSTTQVYEHLAAEMKRSQQPEASTPAGASDPA